MGALRLLGSFSVSAIRLKGAGSEIGRQVRITVGQLCAGRLAAAIAGNGELVDLGEM